MKTLNIHIHIHIMPSKKVTAYRLTFLYTCISKSRIEQKNILHGGAS